jgi:hypothetical protein
MTPEKLLRRQVPLMKVVEAFANMPEDKEDMSALCNA